MAFDAHKNFSVSAVATAPSPAASGTSLVVTAGHGTRFPAVPFNASVWPDGELPTPANAEIVRVTAIATDTFTITRTQESTSARSIQVGDQIAATITAKTLTDVEASIEPTEQTTTATGSQHNFSLSASYTYLRCTGAAPAFTGFTVAGAAPTGGDRVLISCLGTTVTVAHANASSDDANRINTPSLQGLTIGVDGMMLLVYDDTTNRWRATPLGSGAWTLSATSTLTGAQNNWAPGLAFNTYVAWNGASDAAFTGIAGGVVGQLVTVKNITAAMVATFAHQSASSSAGNKLTNYATFGATPIAPGGSITYQYDGTDWQIVAHEQGAWITRTFAAGDYTGFGSMTWTLTAGDVLGEGWYLKGRQLTIAFEFFQTSVAGTPSAALQVATYGGHKAKKTISPGTFWYNDASAKGTGYAYANAGVAAIQLFKNDDSAWTASTNNTGARGTLTFEVQ